MPARASILFLSNGHGEDAIAVSIIKTLFSLAPQEPLELRAFPSVDDGKAYSALGVERLGPLQVMPSGGLLLHSPRLFVADMRAGFLSMTWQQLKVLRSLECDCLVCVGDIYALWLSRLVKSPRRLCVQTLVSRHHHTEGGKITRLNRYFMENISPLERSLMRKQDEVFVRDELTAEFLRAKGVKQARFVGSPLLDLLRDDVFAEPMLRGQGFIVLLPGSRAYAQNSLNIMLQALDHLSRERGQSVRALVALVDDRLHPMEGWRVYQEAFQEQGYLASWGKGLVQVHAFLDRFSAILEAGDVTLATSGTASEQAAAKGLDVVSFPVEGGIQQAFLDNQKRLLKEALHLVGAEPMAIACKVGELLMGQKTKVVRDGVGASEGIARAILEYVR